MLLAFWVDQLNPFLFGLHWGVIGIRYYGLSYVMAFLTAGWLFYRYARAGRSQLPVLKIADLMVAVVLGTLIGGRLGYYLLYHFDELRADPLVLIQVWRGGMASHGGMIGVTLGLFCFSRIEKIPLLHLGDLGSSRRRRAGLFFGRIANFIQWGNSGAKSAPNPGPSSFRTANLASLWP